MRKNIFTINSVTLILLFLLISFPIFSKNLFMEVGVNLADKDEYKGIIVNNNFKTDIELYLNYDNFTFSINNSFDNKMKFKRNSNTLTYSFKPFKNLSIVPGVTYNYVADIEMNDIENDILFSSLEGKLDLSYHLFYKKSKVDDTLIMIFTFPFSLIAMIFNRGSFDIYNHLSGKLQFENNLDLLTERGSYSGKFQLEINDTISKRFSSNYLSFTYYLGINYGDFKQKKKIISNEQFIRTIDIGVGFSFPIEMFSFFLYAKEIISLNKEIKNDSIIGIGINYNYYKIFK